MKTEMQVVLFSQIQIRRERNLLRIKQVVIKFKEVARGAANYLT